MQTVVIEGDYINPRILILQIGALAGQGYHSQNDNIYEDHS
jgi:hypothetical protein